MSIRVLAKTFIRWLRKCVQHNFEGNSRQPQLKGRGLTVTGVGYSGNESGNGTGNASYQVCMSSLMVPGTDRRWHCVVGRLSRRCPRRSNRVARCSAVRRRSRSRSPAADAAHRRLPVTGNGSTPRGSGGAVGCGPNGGGGGGGPHVELLVLRLVRRRAREILARRRMGLSGVGRRLSRPRRRRHSRGRSRVRRRGRRRRWSRASGRRRRRRGGGIGAHARGGVRSLRRPRSRRSRRRRRRRRESRGRGRRGGGGPSVVRRWWRPLPLL